MRLRGTAVLLVLALGSAASVDAQADRWWSRVAALADDRFEGRGTGTEGDRRAAEYVAAEFGRAGLSPAGVDGFMQPVRFRSRRVVEDRSSLTLVGGGAADAIALGDDATINARIEPGPPIDAALVFVGHGLRIPEVGHDDFEGLDLKGKVAVLLTGGPAGIPGLLLSHYQFAGRFAVPDTSRSAAGVAEP